MANKLVSIIFEKNFFSTRRIRRKALSNIETKVAGPKNLRGKLETPHTISGSMLALVIGR